jgi:hypothetical protein
MCDRRELRVRRVYEHDGVARIEWKFEDENDRKLYLATRRPLSHELAGMVVALLGLTAFVVYLSLRSGGRLIPFGILFGIVFPWIVVLERRTRKLAAVELSFSSDKITLVERIGILGANRVHHVATLKAGHSPSAIWAIDGLLFVRKRYYKVVISYRILGDEGIEVAEEWCRRNGIVIEGVKPLPGSYERPVAHPRGL